MNNHDEILAKVNKLVDAYKQGLLGGDKMPEDEAILASLGKSEGLHSGSTSHLVANCEGHRRQLEDFIRAIEDGVPVSCTGEDGLRAVRVICGVYKSAKEAKTVCF